MLRLSLLLNPRAGEFLLLLHFFTDRGVPRVIWEVKCSLEAARWLLSKPS